MESELEVCCFTGHRMIEWEALDGLASRLEEEIWRLVQRGVRHFKSGGALGFDTMAALAVLRVKESAPEITLTVIAPSGDQTFSWSQSQKETYEEIRHRADRFLCLYPTFRKGCMQERNRALANGSGWCVCYLSRARTGTSYTVDCCRKRGAAIINLARPESDAPGPFVPGAPDRAAKK